MSKKFHIIFFFLLFATLFAGAALAREKADGREFDFVKTGAFMKEMETRPDFPVSTVLANDYVISLLALGDRIEPARKSAVVSFLKNSQQKSGGFVADKSDKNASLLYTDIALETLNCLKATAAIDTGKVKSFVASLKNPDGGFGFSQESKGSSLATTFYAVRILKTVGGLDLIDKAQTTRYVMGFERKEGGFGYVKGTGVADSNNTYMAAFVLKALGMLDNATRKNAISFLGTTPYLNVKSKELPELNAQLHTLLALKELGGGTRIDGKLALAFLKKVYVPVNGGFGPILGYGSTPDSTTTAIRTLAELGKLKSPGLITSKM